MEDRQGGERNRRRAQSCEQYVEDQRSEVGQKLSVPAAKAEKTSVATASVIPTSTDAYSVPSGAATSTAPSTGSDDSGNLYVVKSGYSLRKIAPHQNVTTAALKQANNLTGDSLKVGQKLHIPMATAKATTDTAGNTVSAVIAATSSAGWEAPGTYTENGQTIHIVDFKYSTATIAKKYGIRPTTCLTPTTSRIRRRSSTASVW